MRGRIPQSFIDNLVARVDIVALIDKRVTLTKRGREYVACCPFHNEKTPSFSVSPEKQFYHCFGCGAHGTAIGFLMEYERLEYIEAIEALAQDLGVDVPRETGDVDSPAPPQADFKPLYDAQQAAAEYFRQQLRGSPQAIEYLKKRGLSGEIARDFAIGYAPAGWDGLRTSLSDRFNDDTLLAAGLLSRNERDQVYDKFRERIMFPIRDARGRTIAFGGRIIAAGEPKYLNSPETPIFHKSQTLYGLFEMRRQRQRVESILVVEGYMDVVAMAQFGVRNAVATLGTATTAEHLRTLFRGVHRVVFCFDGDRAGKEAAWRALQQCLPVLRDGYEVGFLFLPDGEDPDSFLRQHGQAAFERFAATAVPLSTYLLNTLKERHPAHTLEQATRMVVEGQKLLKTMPPGILHDQIQRGLAAQSGVPLASPQAREPARRPVNRRQQVQMTPLRQVCAALLRQPNLARELGESALSDYAELPDGTLLGMIVDHIHDLGQPTTAALLERLRGTDWEADADGLASWEPPENSQQTWTRLFGDALVGVRRQLREHRLDALLQRSRTTALDDAEKQELTRLLGGRTTA
ncbi:MAG: DNA primase [Thiotrichales bacterium]